MRRTALIIITAVLALTGLQSPAEAVGVTYPTPTLLADLNPNTGFDHIDASTEFNGALYYSGFSPEIGYELRRINATGISEVVADINPNGGSNPYSLTVYQNKLYFIASDPEGNRNLYSITTAGTLVKHVKVGGSSGFGGGEQIAVFNNLLYFYRLDGSGANAGWELWQSNGTTFSLTTIPAHDPQSYLSSFAFEVVNNKLYFSLPITSNSGNTGLGVISTNGIATRAPNSDAIVYPREITKIGSRMAFVAQGPSGTEVYVYDGVNAPIAMNVASDADGIQSSYPSGLFNYKNNLYFSATIQNGGVYEFWRTNGVAQPTRFTGAYFPQGGSINPQPFAEFNGRLYFSAQTDTSDQYDYHRGLFSTDGTTIRAEISGSTLYTSFGDVQYVFGGNLYLTAEIGDGFRLFSFDGQSLREVEHSDYATAGGYLEPWASSAFAVTTDALYFAGYNGQTYGMFKFNGTTTPTLVPGSQDLVIQSIFNVGDVVYASAQPTTYNYQNLFVYKVNQAGELVKLDALSDALDFNPIELITPMADGTLFVKYQNVALLVNGSVREMDTTNLSEVQRGVVSHGNYYFLAVSNEKNVLFKWDGTNPPVQYVDLGLLVWDSPQIFTINGDIYWIRNLGDGPALHKITSSGSESIDYESSLENAYVNETLEIGNTTYLMIYNTGEGKRQMWKGTSAGLELMPSVNTYFDDMNALSIALGRLVVSGFGASGSVIAAVVENNGSVSTILETGVSEYEEIYGRVAGFQGDYYFPYSHPDFGLELATTGSGVSASLPGAPSNLVVGSGTDSTVELSWSAPSNTGGQPLSTYVVEYSSDGSSWKNFYHPASTQTSIVVSGLQFNTNYQFRVRARSFEGDSDATSSVSKKTTVIKPGKVRSLAVAAKGIAKSTAKVTWLAPAVQGSGGIKDYKIETSLNGKKWTVVKDSVSKIASITLSRLKSKTKYYVRVTAIAYSGSGPVSSKVLFKTK